MLCWVCCLAVLNKLRLQNFLQGAWHDSTRNWSYNCEADNHVCMYVCACGIIANGSPTQEAHVLPNWNCTVGYKLFPMVNISVWLTQEEWGCHCWTVSHHWWGWGGIAGLGVLCALCHINLSSSHGGEAWTPYKNNIHRLSLVPTYRYQWV